MFLVLQVSCVAARWRTFLQVQSVVQTSDCEQRNQLFALFWKRPVWKLRLINATYLHGAVTFRTPGCTIRSRNSPHFMGPECSLPCSQQPLVPVPTSTNLFHSTKSDYFKMQFNIIPPSVSVSLSCSLTYGFSNWRLWICSFHCTMREPPTLRPCTVSTD